MARVARIASGLGVGIVLVAAMTLGRCLVAIVQPARPDEEAEVGAGTDAAAIGGDDLRAENPRPPRSMAERRIKHL